MYRDRTLIPTEVIRLCALGTLSLTPMSYADLAREVRSFTARLSGPSLDMMGTSIQLLRTEGLIATVDAGANDAGAALRLTPAGEAELRALLEANLRGPLDDMSRIVFALKLRFLHVLERAPAIAQLDRMIEISAEDGRRCAETRARYQDEPGRFAEWLDADVQHADDRIAWLRALKQRL